MVSAVGHAGRDVAPRMTAMKRLAFFAAVAFASALASFSARADLPFIENDYAKALAQATSKNVPLFVEAWAPW